MRHLPLLSIALVTIATTAQAQRAPLRALEGSELTVEGTTTIGARWHCTATTLTASAELEGGAVRAVTVEVPVSALRCQSGAMERAMRSALRANDDPTSAITGRFSAHGTDTLNARMEGTLKVAGVEQQVALNATTEPQGDGTARVRSTLPLRLTSFDITPPRVLFGAVRARDEIAVKVDLRFPERGALVAARAP